MRRAFILIACLCTTGLALYSCSMHASVTTDGSGRVVEVSSLRVESTVARVVAVAMLVAGGQVAFELRWLRGGADSLGS